MEFSHEFFDDEVREGFYVSGLMKRLWGANMEVLRDVAKVCEKHHIRWFADYGTLLGAVRHGGNVPWDDDLDICMLRDDYNRFLEVAEKELPEHYVVENCYHNLDDLLTRINASGHPSFEDDMLEKYHQSFLVGGIDIFPLDYMPPTKEEQDALQVLVKAIFSFRPFLEDADLDLDAVEDILQQLETLSGKKFDRKDSLLKQIYQAIEGVCQIYGPEGADTVMLAPIWACQGGKTYPLSCFQNAVKMKFEGMDIWVTAEYDTMLKIEYGDYMKIVKGGASHDYPCFTDQIEYVKRDVSEFPFEYQFDEADLAEVKRLDRKTPRETCLKFIKLVENMHGQIRAAFSNGAFETFASLLQSCQNAAIKIGTMLENHFGEGCVPVSVLEAYCEELYQVSMRSEVAATADDLQCALLDENMQAFRDSLKECMPERKEVVILPYRASSWKNIEALWRELQEDITCHVSVILPPYYEKTALAGLGTMHAEASLLPDYVEVTPYDAYDFEHLHPDVIYTQNPYDECNYTSSVHPFFYARNLKKYTDKLVYIPWFTMEELNIANGRAHQTMQYFCTVPGVVLADEVWLPTEMVRDAYIERLTEFAGESTKTIWEEKIKVYRIPVMDSTAQQIYETFPDTWKEKLVCADGSRKKIMMYECNAVSFERYGEKALEKLADMLRYLEENQDMVACIWHRNQTTEDILKVRHPECFVQYEMLVQRFIQAEYGIYNDSLPYQDVAKLADVYYGDGSYISRYFEANGKSGMVQWIPTDTPEGAIPEVRLRTNEQGDFPFHVRAYVFVDDLMYFIPDELNLLCVMRMTDKQIRILDSVPEEKINQTGLGLKLEYYQGSLILIPYMAKALWMYDTKDSRESRWTKVAIRDSEQGWKFVGSEICGEKLYLFPGGYKYITCVDLETLQVTYLEDIYKAYREFSVDENCNFTVGYTRVADCVYMTEQQTNVVFRLDLKTQEYEWKRVGRPGIAYYAIAWDGEQFYLLPKNYDTLVCWDGADTYTEYALPKNCQYEVNGPVNANIIDGKLVAQGFQCDTIVYDLKDMSGYMEPVRYWYWYKRREDFYTGYDRKTDEFVIQDGVVQTRISSVFPKDTLQEYLDTLVASGQVGLDGIIQEDALINLDYLMACLKR